MKLHGRVTLRWFCVATIAACLCLEWQLWHSAKALNEGRRLVSGELASLRTELASEIATAKDRRDEIAKRRGFFEELRQKAAPNRERILRMLKMLAADRRRLDPSDPTRVSMGYGIAALGFRGELLQDAAYANAYRIIERYQIEASHAPLLARLAARNVDSRHLIDLILNSRTAPAEARAIATQEGLGWKFAAAASNDATAASQKEIEEYLGSDNYAEYMAYNVVVTGQYVADQFQQRLSYTGTEMTAEQYEKFSALVGTGEPQDLLEGNITDDTVSASQAVLTPSQLQVLHDFKKERQRLN
jgi:hypothetical protein